MPLSWGCDENSNTFVVFVCGFRRVRVTEVIGRSKVHPEAPMKKGDRLALAVFLLGGIWIFAKCIRWI
jgi:hypothetical protein